MPAPAVLATSHFSSTDAWMLVVVLLLLIVTGFLAMSETAITRMSPIKATAMADDDRKGAKTLARLVAHPEATLNPILLLILISQLITATLVGVVAEHVFGALGVVIATAFEVVVIFVFAEAAPGLFLLL